MEPIIATDADLTAPAAMRSTPFQGNIIRLAGLVLGYGGQGRVPLVTLTREVAAIAFEGRQDVVVFWLGGAQAMGVAERGGVDHLHVGEGGGEEGEEGECADGSASTRHGGRCTSVGLVEF